MNCSLCRTQILSIREPQPWDASMVFTTPLDGQKPSTSGLRKMFRRLQCMLDDCDAWEGSLSLCVCNRLEDLRLVQRISVVIVIIVDLVVLVLGEICLVFIV
ncbi:hypothetical protein Droror1_Dr00017608 [Drosera rotundifolia]